MTDELITYEDLRSITTSLAESDPKQEVRDLGVDDSDLLLFAHEASVKAMTLVAESKSAPGVALAALFVSGFCLGARIALAQETVEA